MLSDKNWQEGYRHAQEDFEKGKGNNFAKRSLNRLNPFAHPESYLPGAENRDNSYRSGYTTDHADAVRNINVLAVNLSPTISATTGATTSDPKSLAHHLELLEDLKNHIELLQSQMESMMQQYRVKVQNMHEAGMATERYDRLQRDVFEPTNAAMKTFVNSLQSWHLEIVRRTREKVAEALVYEQVGSR